MPAAKKEGQVSPQALVRFGTDLRRERIARGMTLEQVSAICTKTASDGSVLTMNKSEISRIERGLKHNVEFDTLHRLADAVGMRVDLQLTQPDQPKGRQPKRP